jgi:hypothetical protein
MPAIAAEQLVRPFAGEEDLYTVVTAGSCHSQQCRVARANGRAIRVPDRQRPQFQKAGLIDWDATNWDAKVLSDALGLVPFAPPPQDIGNIAAYIWFEFLRAGGNQT